MIDDLEFPDWSAFLQWKEREEMDTFTYYAKPNGNKEGKHEGKMLHKYLVYVLYSETLQKWKLVFFTLVVVMEGQRKITVQKRALRSESIGDHANWRNTACLELWSERRKVEKLMPSTFVLIQIMPLG